MLDVFWKFAGRLLNRVNTLSVSTDQNAVPVRIEKVGLRYTKDREHWMELVALIASGQ